MINTYITKQIESLNSLVCLIIKGIIPVFTQWLLECFNCIYEKSELISKNYKANMSWSMCANKCVKIKNIVHNLVISSLCVALVQAHNWAN